MLCGDSTMRLEYPVHPPNTNPSPSAVGADVVAGEGVPEGAGVAAAQTPSIKTPPTHLVVCSVLRRGTVVGLRKKCGGEI